MSYQNQQQTPRSPAHASEVSVLGAILNDNGLMATVADGLVPSDFVHPFHANLFAEIQTYVAAGRIADAVTLSAKFNEDDLIGLSMQARENAYDEASLHAYADEIRLLATQRAISGIAASFQRKMSQPGAHIDAEVSALQRQLDDTMGRFAVQDSGVLDEGLAEDLVANFKKDLESTEKPDVIPTGIKLIDSIIDGLEPSQLITLAGRPGSGKSAAAAVFALNIAEAGEGVGFISLEMRCSELLGRMASTVCYRNGTPVPYKFIKRGKLFDGNKPHVMKALDHIANLPIKISSVDGMDMAKIAAFVRRTKREFERKGKRLRVLIVDYLGLVSPTSKYGGQKVNEVGEISRMMKQLAKRENIAIVSLHQVNRQCENRDDKRPMMSDLRDSGAVEQDSNIIMLTYRESYYLKQKLNPSLPPQDFRDLQDKIFACENEFELNIAKARGSDTGQVKLWCAMAHNELTDPPQPGGDNGGPKIVYSRNRGGNGNDGPDPVPF